MPRGSFPYRGSWLDFEFDAKDLVFVRIDRRRKLPVTVLLRALAMDTEEIFEHFYAKVMHTRTDDGWKAPIEPERLRGDKLLDDLVNAATGKTVVEAGRRVTARVLKKIGDAGMTEKLITSDKLIGQYAADDMINPETGEVLIEAGSEIEEQTLEVMEECGIDQIAVLDIDHINVGAYIRNTIRQDRTTSREEALLEIYKVMRPGEPPTVETAEKLFYDLFFGKAQMKEESVDARAVPDEASDVVVRLKRSETGDVWVLEQEEDWLRVIVPSANRPEEAEDPVWVPAAAFATIGSERYDLSDVGRVKMGMRLNLDGDDNLRVLRRKDIVSVVTTLVALKDGRGDIDDIDHLGNRRVRSVGELMENQYRIGLLRMERAIRERMSSVDIDTVMPHDLINAKPAAAAVREFFGSSQLSQFMDQTNPLSEITHKRRLSALGPGGLTRERAGFEVRDVHPSHYGRICPVETPEGPNIGADQQPRHLRAGQPLRLHRKPLPQGGRRPADRRGRLSVGDRGREVHDRAGQRDDGRERLVRRGPGELPAQRRVRHVGARRHRLHGRLAEAARLGRRSPHPLPGERRREPGADGLQHAAPGGAARARRGAAGRHRHGRDRGAGFRRRHCRAAQRDRRAGRCHPHRGSGRGRGGRKRGVRRRRHLQPAEVPAFQPEHVHHPAARSSAWGSGSWRPTSSPTAPAPTMASSRSGGTCSSPSCRGTATTSRIRS